MQEPTLPDLDEDDIADIDAIIADAEAEIAARRALAAKHKRLARGTISEDERLRILAEIRTAEDIYVWRTIAGVALFHSQHCLSCGHTHRFFMGWMTLQQHKRDPNCRRYIRGAPVEPVERHTEDHAQADVEMCSDCAESCIAIDAAIRGAGIGACV